MLHPTEGNMGRRKLSALELVKVVQADQKTFDAQNPGVLASELAKLQEATANPPPITKAARNLLGENGGEQRQTPIDAANEPHVEPQTTHPEPSHQEKEWIERMVASGCDRETARRIYHGSLSRGHEFKSD